MNKTRAEMQGSRGHLLVEGGQQRKQSLLRRDGGLGSGLRDSVMRYDAWGFTVEVLDAKPGRQPTPSSENSPSLMQQDP